MQTSITHKYQQGGSGQPISRTRTAKTRQLQFVWRHKLVSNGETTDGKEVEVLDAGLFNRRGDAPDYFNVKLKLNGVLWVGNVVVTENASDWYLNGMDKDKAYDNVILAVVGNADTDIINSEEQQCHADGGTAGSCKAILDTRIRPRADTMPSERKREYHASHTPFMALCLTD